MWNLDDASTYVRFYVRRLPFVYTWGQDDKSKRERIRSAVAEDFPTVKPVVAWWALRLLVRKHNAYRFDIENTIKIIGDAFSADQLVRDQSPYTQRALYPDDTIKYLKIIQVADESIFGRDALAGNALTIEIFGRIIGTHAP